MFFSIEYYRDKAARSGFLIRGRTATKDGVNPDLLSVDGGGTKVYVDDDETKAARSGFLIRGRTATKEGVNPDLLSVDGEGTKVFIDDKLSDDSKAARSGFLIRGRTATKDGSDSDRAYLKVATDGTQVHFDEDASKAARSGFLITGRTATKSTDVDYMTINKDSTRFYINGGSGAKGDFGVAGLDDDSKANSNNGGFAVSGRGGSKGNGNGNLFNIDLTTTAKTLNGVNRIYWYPESNAFMAGNLKVDNATDVGLNSFNAGYQNKAKGKYSQAFGFKSEATGETSIAIGNVAKATGKSSFAFGESTTAAGESSVAIGVSAQTGSSAQNAFAFGKDSKAQSTSSVAIGEGATTDIWAPNAYAFGKGANATGVSSYAIGEGAQATSDTAYALGKGAKATAHGSYAFGAGAEASGAFSYAFGSTSKEYLKMGSIKIQGPKATGDYSYAFGPAAKAFGEGAFAIGKYAEATEYSSFSIGEGSKASGIYSVAMGYETKALGRCAIAIGRGANASYINPLNPLQDENVVSISIGKETNASGKNSIAIGIGVDAYKENLMVLGRYNTNTVTNDDRIFVIGDGYSEYSSSDALVITGYYGSGDMKVSRHILPMTTSNMNYNLGADDQRWQTVYANNIDVNNIVKINGALTSTGLATFNGTIKVVSSAVTKTGYFENTAPSAKAYAIYAKGDSENNNYAGWFDGDLKVTKTIFGTVSTSSDAHLKKDVQTIEGALDKVLKLRGVSYYWKNNEELGADSTQYKSDTDKHIGVIAQELEQVFPELVSDDKMGFKTVNYDGIAPILIEAIKEQQSIIEGLESKVEKLEKLVEELLKKQ